MMKFAVTISTRDWGKYLIDTVKQLKKESFKGFEIIVTEQSEECDQSIVEILTILDDDIKIKNDLIKKHLEAYKKYPKRRHLHWSS